MGCVVWNSLFFPVLLLTSHCLPAPVFLLMAYTGMHYHSVPFFTERTWAAMSPASAPTCELALLLLPFFLLLLVVFPVAHWHAKAPGPGYWLGTLAFGAMYWLLASLTSLSLG